MERPAKRARLLEDDESGGEEGAEATLTINDEYAKRHHHNAARAELHRLEEKFKNESEEETSDSESEDDEGDLATKELDDEILATLKAIKTKDPRVYNKDVKFYTDEEIQAQADKKDKSKPVTLRDYHRKNLLEGKAIEDEDEDVYIPTYEQEQSALKRDLLKQIDADSDQDEESGDSDGGVLLVPKVKAPPKESKKEALKQLELDVKTADKDPETYLSNFMASRAWTTDSGHQFEAFESDDDGELDQAEKFEAAYNLRFEDPNKLNEALISHSRQAAEKYSVRREEPKGRKKARQDEKERRDEEKKERESDKARLRRLKIEEAHANFLRLKEAAGLKHQHIPDDKLVKFLEKGFDDENWDAEMGKLLGADYYEQGEDDDGEVDEDVDMAGEGKKRKLKKPKWDDDIDIGDIDPDFMTREEQLAQGITLSDDENDDAEGEDAEVSTRPNPKQKKKDAEKKRSEQKRQSRLERRKIEQLVDAQLEDDLPTSKHSGFRYRETSPSALGLSARDILMADDTQLNQFAGLKKLAAFRDEYKKQQDRKKLGKKARLRQWRKDTFGTEEQAKDEDFEAWFNRNRGLESREMASGAKTIDTDAGEVKPKKKKKKSRKRAVGEVEA